MLAKDNDLVTKFVLGKNDTGDEIKGIKVGYQGEGKVNHLVIGTHHGNELDAAEAILSLGLITEMSLMLRKSLWNLPNKLLRF